LRCFGSRAAGADPGRTGLDPVGYDPVFMGRSVEPAGDLEWEVAYPTGDGTLRAPWGVVEGCQRRYQFDLDASPRAA